MPWQIISICCASQILRRPAAPPSRGDIIKRAHCQSRDPVRYWSGNQGNAAAHGEHGRMWGHAYSVTPAGLWVAPESDIMKPEDLAGIEVAVGYHSGSHFSALQGLEQFLPKDEIKLQFVGGPGDRCQLALDRRVQVANVFGTLSYVLEQQGFRKIVDTSFMIGFLINGDATDEQLWAYFNALQRAQREIDVAKEQYQHYLLDQLPAKYHDIYNPRASGIGERLVFEPYTQETFERTHKWMLDWGMFPEDQVGHASYDSVVTV